MRQKNHWEEVYQRKSAAEVSWFQEHASVSLRLIEDAKIPYMASIIDIGGGASVLTDDLLGKGFSHISVLDISGSALSVARERLGCQASNVQWIEADVLDYSFKDESYDLWHDRAVFHFLASKEDRQAYVRKMQRALKPGGIVIVATFAEDGPTECSRLPVMRYSAKRLQSEFGKRFRLEHHEKESHETPSGSKQQFVYCVFRRTQHDASE